MSPEVPPNNAQEKHESTPLRNFFETRVLPYLDEETQEHYEELDSFQFGFIPELIKELYEEFSNYDPEADHGERFYTSVVLHLISLVTAENDIAFEGVIETFLEKLKKAADILYREAFFRNSYDTLSAWQSCERFKRYQKLFYGLNVLPEGAKERIASMSAELDALWSTPEVEKEFDNAMADQYVADGVGKSSMLIGMYRNRDDRKPFTKEKYEYYHQMYPGLLPETYEAYLEKEEKFKHPYILGL